MFSSIIDSGQEPPADWEIEFNRDNFNSILNREDWEVYCATHIPDHRLQLAMTKAQICGMIEVSKYQETINAAKMQGMKDNEDFYVESTSSYLVMRQIDRFELTNKDRREHLMTLLHQAREQKLAREQLQQMKKKHALRKTGMKTEVAGDPV